MESHRTKETDSGQNNSPFPTVFADLSEDLGKNGLVKVILETVLKLDTAQSTWLSRASAPHNCQPRMLLTLMSYCYATGRYGSGDIVEAIWTDPTIRYICAGEFPDERALRRFRREHRDVLEYCLLHLLKRAWAYKLDAAEVSFLGYQWYEDELTTQLSQEARLRIEMARFIDLVQCDG